MLNLLNNGLLAFFTCVLIHLLSGVSATNLDVGGTVFRFADDDDRPWKLSENLSRKKREATNSCDSSHSTLEKFVADANNTQFVEKSVVPGGRMKKLQLTFTGPNNNEILFVMGDYNVSYAIFVRKEHSDSYDDLTEKFLTASKLSTLNSLSVELVLMKHPLNSQTVFFVANNYQEDTSILVATYDSGQNFALYSLPFLVSSGFQYHSSNPNLILGYDDMKKLLYLSENEGKNWTLILDDVYQYKWSTIDGSNDIYGLRNNETNFFLRLFGGSAKNNHLMRSTDLGKRWKLIRDNVYTFGMEANFLYISAFVRDTYETQDERHLFVSKSNGSVWNHARLPSITSDRFYSILDADDGMIFIHVDDPQDTGHGTLYTSDERGIIFSESLPFHLYPNFEDLTDFYHVKSIRGTYITNTMQHKDNSINTVISHNRGADWQSISLGTGVTCDDGSSVCSLQIHNLYSIKRGIKASPPLSISTAPGLILAHGVAAQSLQTTPPDVYVTNDGGYNWFKALSGPHYYQIADSGNILVALPMNDDNKPEYIKFSTNGGHCWIEHRFVKENDSITFTGMLIEPGSKANYVTVWGYTDDRQWQTYVINFTVIITKECVKEDYITLTPHGHDDNKGCLLGMKEDFQIVNPNSTCYNAKGFEPTIRKETCKCTKDDYSCDYGFKRVTNSETCERDLSIDKAELEICQKETNMLQKVQFNGYRLTPGNKCKGGYQPPVNVVVNLTLCYNDSDTKALAAQLDAATTTLPNLAASRSKSIVWGLTIFVGAVLVILIVTLLAKKIRVFAKRTTGYRYASIRCEEDGSTSVPTAIGTLGKNTSLYETVSESEDDQDDDAIMTAVPSDVAILDTSASNGPNNDKLIHLDVSDDELLK